MGDDSHSVFRQKLLGEEGSVRPGVVTAKQPGLFSLKFRGNVFARFHAVAAKLRSRTRQFTVWPVGTGASRYRNCCIDGGTSPEYFGFLFVCFLRKVYRRTRDTPMLSR
jgi:hypothetical protein